MSQCTSCDSDTVVSDSSTDGFPVCTTCGVIQSFDLYEHQAFDSTGRALDSGVPPDRSYRELKHSRAIRNMKALTSILGLSSTRARLVSRMVHDVTNSELGEGDWFQVLVAACSHIVTRQQGLPLSISEAADAIGRDASVVGRMVSRVVSHLGLDSLPEFDIYESLVRSLESCECLQGLEEGKTEQMATQGRFLLRCCIKWSLTTGRHPLPLVAAVIAFLAEVNGVSVAVEDIALETFASVSTARARKREIKRTLVGAAKALLPWGGDVDVKNIAHHAPLLLRYMENRSKARGLDLGTFRPVPRNDYGGGERADAVNSEPGKTGKDALQEVKLSVEGLSNTAKTALESFNLAKAADGFGKNSGRKRKRGDPVVDVRMGIKSTEKISAEQIPEIDVGYDVLPPSFLAGMEAREVRRQKIRAAKARILEIRRPSEEASPEGSRSRRNGAADVNWEDCMIELLLLHGVKEEEIEEGHYRRLLDLHIFNSMDRKKVRCLRTLLRKAHQSIG